MKDEGVEVEYIGNYLWKDVKGPLLILKSISTVFLICVSVCVCADEAACAGQPSVC